MCGSWGAYVSTTVCRSAGSSHKVTYNQKNKALLQGWHEHLSEPGHYRLKITTSCPWVTEPLEYSFEVGVVLKSDCGPAHLRPAGVRLADVRCLVGSCTANPFGGLCVATSLGAVDVVCHPAATFGSCCSLTALLAGLCSTQPC